MCIRDRYDLARMFADGLGMEADPHAAQDWYAKALAAFMEAESSAKERQKPYLQYRIGKMYAAGLGTVSYTHLDVYKRQMQGLWMKSFIRIPYSWRRANSA